MHWSIKFLAIVFFLPLTLPAQTRTVWEIGKFDESAFEFSSLPIPNVAFTVGKSSPKQDWPQSQRPGTHSKIAFSLDAVKGTYRLRVTALTEPFQPRVPAFQIAVNGHSGVFFLHPKLSYSRSGFAFSFDPHEWSSTISVPVPANFLQAGENTISLSCVDEPVNPHAEVISGISYDALSFEQDQSAKDNPKNITAVVEPTIFYRENSGQLEEVVDAFLCFEGTVKAGKADLEVNGKQYSQPIASAEFGEQRISFAVAEWQGTANGKLSVEAGARKSFAVSLGAQRKWSVFVVPHTHLDVGYTDYQGKVAEIQPRVLSQAAALISEHPDFRFSMDGSWNLEQLLDTRPKTKQDEILGLIRSGKIAMPAQYFNLLTGYASLETLYRSLYQSKAYAKQYHLPFEYANITDVPTYSGSYPSVLAASGVKYWVAAANNDRAPILHYDHWNEKSPFWWEGPDGKKVLFWYSRHYEQVQTLFGLPPQLEAVRESLPIYLQAYAKPSYKPDVALIYGTQVENTDLFPQTATFVNQWNKNYAYPKMQYATFPDFFHYVEQHFGKDLPTYKGDGGGYWEDGIGSDAYYAAEDRQNQNRVLSAEVLSTVTHSLDANLNPPREAFDDIWRNILLFAEHTWASYNSVSQPGHDETTRQLKIKDDRAERAALQIEDVTNRSLSQLADQIHIPGNTLVVFNSLSWQRDIPVEVDLFEHPKLKDLSNGQEIPLQVLYRKEKFLHVRFLATALPAVGYKCYSINYEHEGSPTEQSTKESTAENSFYRVKVDETSGAIQSIYDKQLQRELVDAKSPYKFGQYLYVTGGDGDTQMINPFPALPPGKLTIHPASAGHLVAAEHLPWGESIRTVSSSVNTPKIETEILLFNNEKKIEFRFRVRKDYTENKEAVYFAFPVALSSPGFTYATQQAWVDPARDLMKGGSLEWFNIQSWMAAHDANVSVGIVPLDASLASFGDINRGRWPGEFKPQNSTIFSYAMNNYWHTNYRAGQGGDFTFRYTMTSSAQLNGGALSKLGLEAMRPAELDYVVTQDKAGNPERPLPPEGQGFLDQTGNDVALVTWKKAEDGNGTIARVAEIGGHATNAVLHFPRFSVTGARLCSGVEEDQSDLQTDSAGVHLSLHSFEVVTVRLITTR